METLIQTESTTNPTARFGNGRYSGVAEECFKDAQRVAGFSEPQADRLARSLASDLGRIKFSVSVSYGRTNSDGKVTMGEIGKAKGIVETPAITIARLIGKLDDLRKFVKIQDNAPLFEFELNETLSIWLNSKD